MKHWLQIQKRIEEAILAGGILTIAALMIANVLTRSLFGFSLTFGEELSQFLIVLVCFVGLSYAVSQRRHIRMTAFSDLVTGPARWLLAATISATTSALLAFMAWVAAGYVRVVADLGSVSPVLSVPLYVVYLAAPFGFGLSAARYAALAFEAVRERKDPAATDRGREPSGHSDRRLAS